MMNSEFGIRNSEFPNVSLGRSDNRNTVLTGPSDDIETGTICTRIFRSRVTRCYPYGTYPGVAARHSKLQAFLVLTKVDVFQSQKFARDGWSGGNSEFRIPNSEFEEAACA